MTTLQAAIMIVGATVGLILTLVVMFGGDEPDDDPMEFDEPEDERWL